MSVLGSILTGPLIEIAGKVLDRVIPDKAARAEAKAKLTSEILKNEAAFAQAAAKVIVAEAQGHSWMQRNWRPSLMFTIMGLMIWNGVAAPLIAVGFGVDLPLLQAWQAIPAEMWTLLSIGVGGYIAGRSGEKIASSMAGRRGG